MTPLGWFVVIGVPLLLVVLLLEGRRQERKYGKAGSGTRLMRAGVLELQSLLEPDRKVEILKLEEQDQEQAHPAGDPPDPGRRR